MYYSLGRHMYGRAARHEDLDPGRALQQGCQLVSCIKDVFEVVDEQQNLPIAKVPKEALDWGVSALLGNPESAMDFRDNLAGVTDGANPTKLAPSGNSGSRSACDL